MAGVDGFRKMQLGAESTAGTAVAATAIWRGKAGMPDDRRVVAFPEEDISLISGDSRTYTPQYDAGIAFPETEMSFEQPYILEAGIKAVGTGVADGAGAGKIYTYPLPTDAASLNTLKTYTIESGDNQQAEEMEYAFVEDFKISGKPGEAVKWSANWRGRQWTTTTFTGALSLPTVETILASKGLLYIDAVGGTLGGTQVSASLLGMELNVKTGWRPVFTGDGSLYFNTIECVRELLEVTLQLTFRHNASAVSEKANWRAETARKLRLQYNGSAITAGTAYSTKALRIDLAGKWDKFEALGNEGGIHTSTGVFRARKDTTASLFANIIVVNTLSTIP